MELILFIYIQLLERETKSGIEPHAHRAKLGRMFLLAAELSSS